MSRLQVLALIVLSVLVLPGIHATAAETDAAAREEAEKAAQAFQSLYGDELKRVAATRDVADDLAMAAKLLGAARAAESQPALLAVLCEKCFDLAAEDPKGHETAAAAAELQTKKVPQRAQAMQERVLSLCQRQYDAARGDARNAAGEALIKCLTDVAAARTGAGAGAAPGAFSRRRRRTDHRPRMACSFSRCRHGTTCPSSSSPRRSRSR